MTDAALHNRVLDLVLGPAFIQDDGLSGMVPRIKAYLPFADWQTIGRAVVDSVEIARETLSLEPFDPKVRAAIAALDAQRVVVAAFWYATAPELPRGFNLVLAQRFRLSPSELREALMFGQQMLDEASK